MGSPGSAGSGIRRWALASGSILGVEAVTHISASILANT